MPKAFACPPDRASLTGEYAEWLAWYTRSGWAGGIARHDWGFDLANARHVTIWHGGQDVNVTPSHGVWLAEHIPAAELRLLPEEGHISIGLRFPEIVDDLLARAGGTEPSIDGAGA
jgi:pimeloyl-ACP methyl ester carboxylesterase